MAGYAVMMETPSEWISASQVQRRFMQRSLFPTWNYEQGVVELHAGDVIVACTDGVTEATNADGEEWGVEGLQEALAERNPRTSQDIVDTIFEALDEYGRCLSEDVAQTLSLPRPDSSGRMPSNVCEKCGLGTILFT